MIEGAPTEPRRAALATGGAAAAPVEPGRTAHERSGDAAAATAARARAALLAAALVAMTVLAYLPALQGGFVWDDDNYVTANPTLLNLDGLRRIWVEPDAVPQYYPLTFTTFWVEYHLWELAPFGYHLVNVLLHALSAVLFWQLLRRLGVPGAWFAGAIFALHPMHVESVAWITERKNVLSGACYLGAALAYLRFATGPQRARWPWYALALLLFVGALLSKTVTCSLPAALLLVLWWKRGRLDWRDVAGVAPFVAVGLAAAAMTVWMERHHVGAQGAEWTFSLVEHVLIAGRILWFYLWTLLWPANLMFFYPRWQIDAAAWWQYLFPLAALATAGALWLGRRRIGLAALVVALFYAGTLLPALGFFNVYPMRYSFVADHFAYLATLGPIALIAALAARAADRLRATRVSRSALAAALLIVLGVLSWQRATAYEDVETLWTDTVEKNPDSWAGRLNLGGVLADQGRIDEALAQFQVALRLWPASPEAHNALGAMLDQQGEWEAAAAEFREALRLEPRYYEAHTNLGIVLASSGKPIEALDHLTIAVRLKPRYVEAYYHVATTLVQLNRPTDAAKYFATTLLLAPEHAGAHSGLCALQVDQGRFADAAAHCQQAIRLNASDPEPYEHLAAALRGLDQGAEAQAAAEQARRLRHDGAAMHRRSAASLAQQGRPQAAIAQLQEALRLLPGDAAAQAQLAELLAARPRPTP
ncbi:tetratricopeptide repeat protein [bacterium]|nr:tetratricopeptide repeat protein [bacterium]